MAGLAPVEKASGINHAQELIGSDVQNILLWKEDSKRDSRLLRYSPNMIEVDLHISQGCAKDCPEPFCRRAATALADVTNRSSQG
ncbi:hypothetical protein CLAFUW4_00065 [Fulvia fulva]|uniref:Uncharacterized protein n=1 Tax=Passalora fulva TaxID=5499 RepID=A0A9Q8L648_PASFU|nr:uncharacterized protein CLAFUR5_00063 [Fulvia fulva]KAK4635509.1 hypothetical protein CLAFUR4_00065 [Fulvia fulva]KAK4637781.1 hypothetical protein CLAFUR0_00064 [Fulvia fulva]UJO11570.1 hypothetical protein CLAFUR5_00063 [Fulvia fulva]WPV09403.1 hypothetical protein CLAFUW4_00065 [Fulvia fulva]WPV23307.1 hypothetical protein CLAFUW7_00065 [Fulvia fulva]